jgi:nicotinamide-nucleotide adenylyltransferase
MVSRGIFIGRFQPFHLGHLVTVKYALEKVDELIIVIGSAQISHESKNPFTAGERIQMIKNSLSADATIDYKRILIIPVHDVNTHYLWTYQVDMMVPSYQTVFSNDLFTRELYQERGVEVIHTSLYKRKELSGTEIRCRMAEDGIWNDLVPIQTATVIEEIEGIRRIKAIHSRYSKSNH